MKKLITIIGLMGILVSINAQTSSTNAPSPWDTILQMGKDLGLSHPTNFAVAPFMDYSLKGKQKIGGGILGLFNFSQNIGMGVGIEEMGGQAWMPSGQVELKLPLKPLAFLGNNAVGNLIFTPFVDAGITVPVAGSGNANGNVGAIAGSGAAIDVVGVLGGTLSAWGAYENFSNVGEYSGGHIWGGVCQRWGF